jgi:hypothetical protein
MMSFRTPGVPLPTCPQARVQGRLGSIMACSIILLLLGGPRGECQESQEQPPPARARVRPVDLDKLNWIVGVWRQIPGEDDEYEQHWSAPVDDAMMGMFRMVSAGRVVVYEFLLIEKGPEGTFLRLRHYRPGMLDLDRFPFRLQLIRHSDDELVFENPDGDHPKRITYRRPGAGRMDILVESIEDGKSNIFELRFQQPTITRRPAGGLRR